MVLQKETLETKYKEIIAKLTKRIVNQKEKIMQNQQDELQVTNFQIQYNNKLWKNFNIKDAIISKVENIAVHSARTNINTIKEVFNKYHIYDNEFRMYTISQLQNAINHAEKPLYNKNYSLESLNKIGRILNLPGLQHEINILKNYTFEQYFERAAAMNNNPQQVTFTQNQYTYVQPTADQDFKILLQKKKYKTYNYEVIDYQQCVDLLNEYNVDTKPIYKEEIKNNKRGKVGKNKKYKYYITAKYYDQVISKILDYKGIVNLVSNNNYNFIYNPILNENAMLLHNLVKNKNALKKKLKTLKQPLIDNQQLAKENKELQKTIQNNTEKLNSLEDQKSELKQQVKSIRQNKKQIIQNIRDKYYNKYRDKYQQIYQQKKDHLYNKYNTMKNTLYNNYNRKFNQFNTKKNQFYHNLDAKQQKFDSRKNEIYSKIKEQTTKAIINQAREQNYDLLQCYEDEVRKGLYKKMKKELEQEQHKHNNKQETK